jgi:hypothetical protein
MIRLATIPQRAIELSFAGNIQAVEGPSGGGWQAFLRSSSECHGRPFAAGHAWPVEHSLAVLRITLLTRAFFTCPG